ncbi:MAG: hypothetical protein A3F13_03390 [Gammaproteobacteria bacterium RIFCSPHIGHO2_12_FULL_40_19]|nr:MAG: hypothetical protein A3F13_03390 [Gammaproteobacteria bacterium RIFCSPHIGHO2_12_FULL_40_19]
MAFAIRKNPPLKRWLSHGDHKVRFFWTRDSLRRISRNRRLADDGEKIKKDAEKVRTPVLLSDISFARDCSAC